MDPGKRSMMIILGYFWPTSEQSKHFELVEKICLSMSCQNSWDSEIIYENSERIL